MRAGWRIRQIGVDTIAPIGANGAVIGGDGGGGGRNVVDRPIPVGGVWRYMVHDQRKALGAGRGIAPG